MESRSSLPPNLEAFFWDYAPGAVSWDAHREFIIERVLARGDWDAIRWLRTELGDEALRAVIMRTHGRSLTRPQIRLWQLLLDLPEADVDSWLKDVSREIWDRRSA